MNSRKSPAGAGRTDGVAIAPPAAPGQRFVFFAGLLLGLALWAMSWPLAASAQTKAPGDSPPPVVNVAPVTEMEVNPPLELVGRVEAVQTVDLRARVQGFLEKVSFKEGAPVKEGQILYQIEKAPYQAQVEVDRAKLAKAQAGLDKAAQYMERLKTVRTGAVSATDLDTARADELEAKAEVQEAKAVLDQSLLNLGYTTITSPIDGIIGATAFTKGNLVGPDSGTLATVVQQDPIRVVFSFSETMLPEIQAARLNRTEKDDGQLIQLRLPGGQTCKEAGRPEFLDNVVDSKTGTIAMRAVFRNPRGFLIPGQYVSVLIRKSEAEVLPVVPQAAVLEDREGRYVLTVGQGDKVEIRRIKTGPQAKGMWSVESGLKKGERIIVRGVQKVRPGQVVDPRPDSGNE